MSSYVSAIEYELDSTIVALEYAWRGDNNYAHFNDTLYGVGATAWWDNIGVRLGYLEGKPLYTKGKFKSITVNLDYVLSLELLYKYELYDRLILYGGIGTHIIPVPMYWKGIDPNSHAANDSDNDEGYILGIKYHLLDSMSIGWRFTHYSRIKEEFNDEWIKGHSLNIHYMF